MSPRLLLTLFVLVGSAPAFHAERAPYSPEQLALVRTVAEARLSPDGKTVAFVTDITGALELWAVPAAGGWPHQLTELGEQVTDVRWSPDGAWLVFAADVGGNDRGALFRVPAEGGVVERLSKAEMAHGQPRFSPDGKRLAFVADPDPDREFLFQLHVLDLATQKIRPLTQEKVNVETPIWSPDGSTLAAGKLGTAEEQEAAFVKALERGVPVEPPAVPTKGWRSTNTDDTGKNSALLRKNLGSAVVEGEDAHHLVQSTHLRAEESRKILDKYQIDINSAENGVYLKPSGPRPAHHGQGLHSFKGIDAVTARLKNAIDGITDWAKGREAVLDELDQIRREILAGTFPP